MIRVRFFYDPLADADTLSAGPASWSTQQLALDSLAEELAEFEAVPQAEAFATAKMLIAAHTEVLEEVRSLSGVARADAAEDRSPLPEEMKVRVSEETKTRDTLCAWTFERAGITPSEKLRRALRRYIDTRYPPRLDSWEEAAAWTAARARQDNSTAEGLDSVGDAELVARMASLALTLATIAGFVGEWQTRGCNRRSGQSPFPFVARWRAAALAPFLRELSEPHALPFRDALRAYEVGSWTPLAFLMEIATRFSLPFPHVWASVLCDLMPDENGDGQGLTCIDDSSWRAPADIWKHQSLEVAFIPKEHEGRGRSRRRGGQRPTWPCDVFIAPAYESEDALRRWLEEQIRRTFAAAWGAARRHGWALTMQVLSHPKPCGRVQEDGGLQLPDDASPADLEGLGQRRLIECPLDHLSRDWLSLRSARRACVRQLLAALDPAPAIEPSGPQGGPVPDWQDAARWWALHTFERLSAERIAAREDPESVDPGLPERIRQALHRVRGRAQARRWISPEPKPKSRR